MTVHRKIILRKKRVKRRKKVKRKNLKKVMDQLKKLLTREVIKQEF
jgi:hypothetical protein